MLKRVAELARRHRVIDRQIAAEHSRPAACSLRLQRLKRLRPRIKDEIALQQGVLRTLYRRVTMEAMRPA